MKTLKKLLSLTLVAMLLVTAIPFQASAEGYTYTLKMGGETKTITDNDGILKDTELWDAIGDNFGLDGWDDEALGEWIDEKCPVDLTKDTFELNLDDFKASSAGTASGNESNNNGGNNGGGSIQEIGSSETPKEDEKNDTPVANTTKTYPVRTFNNAAEGPQVGYVECNPNDSADVMFEKAVIITGKKSDYKLYSFWNDVLWVTGGSTTGTGTGTGTGTEAQKFTVQVKTDGGTVSLSATEGTKYSTLLAGIGEGYGKKITGYRSENKGLLSGNELVNGNDTVTILYETVAYSLTLDNNRKGTEYAYKVKRVYIGQAIGDLPTPVAPDGYVFVGWKLNGKYIDKDTIWELPGDATAYAEYKLANDKNQPMTGTGTVQDGKVYLEIYTNDNTKSVAKRVDITKYADDNKITQAEAEKVIRSYFTAKSGYSLKMIGLFDENGWWWYTRDDETKGQKEIVVNRDGDDYVYVMVNNVKTSVADSSNPKTGDSIVSTLAGLGLSASMLATLCYIIGKKRLF